MSDLTTRRFTQAEVGAFGLITGDLNPVHVDPVAARRMIFNRPVVHGVMLISWALDHVLQLSPGRRQAIVKLSATFERPVAVGDVARLVIEGDSTDGRFIVATNGATAVRGSLSMIDSVSPSDGHLQCEVAPRPPDEPDPASYRSACGTELLELGQGHGHLLPNVRKLLPGIQFAALAAVTRIVGMRCPGLRSILSDIDLTFMDGNARSVDWRVDQFDDRFRRLVLALISPVVRGTITAFERPIAQPNPPDVASMRPKPGEFDGARVLVIGATRGLGEAFARQAVAGGARVFGTFHLGSSEAATLTRELNSGTGQIRFEQLDIFDEQCPQLLAAIRSEQFSHFIYAATPPISVGAKGTFSHEAFDVFLKAYVYHFARLFELVRSGSPGLRGVLFPSSVFVQQRQSAMTEYSMAKAAAEVLLRDLSARHPRIRFLVPRLPRLNTDQTINRVGLAGDDPSSVALELLRQLH